MALLTDAERQRVSTFLQRHWSAITLPTGVTKAELKAAVDAVDAWCEANQASFNAAIPLPARTVLSTEQKAWLLCYVVRQRILDLT